MWCYDAPSNSWSQLDCIGYIPVAREGHAASLVDDVMYIFGGRNEDGADLGDLAAFRISSRRWYTFQNMGPSPSPRSGHSMTTVNKSVVVVGGEPSSAATTVNDLGLLYMLDTTKIRYPSDSQIQQGAQRAQSGARRPSQSEPSIQGPSAIVASRNAPSRDNSQGPADPKRLIAAREGGVNSPTNGFRLQTTPDVNGAPTAANAVVKLPRAAGPPQANGPPPQQAQPPKPAPAANVTSLGRVRNPSSDRGDYAGPSTAAQNQSPVAREIPKDLESPIVNGRRTPTQPGPKAAPKPEAAPPETKPKQVAVRHRGQSSVDSSTEPGLKAIANRPSSPPPPTRQASNPLARRSSGRNSQTVALLKELDSARNRNAWYASELELARKSGYVANTSLSPVLDSRATETFDDEDKPLIEALLAMRAELADVQTSIDKQAIVAAKQIAEAEKQRDAAIQEAVYAKAKLAAHMGGASAQLDSERSGNERSEEISRKLAFTLNTQKDLQAQIDRTAAEAESERRARKLAEDTVAAAQRRMTELESFKQQNSAEVERLKAELHVAQRAAREQSVVAAEAAAAAQMLRVEKDDYEVRYQEAVGSSKASGDTFETLREAMAASAETKSLLEKRLEEERSAREKGEAKLNKLKAEHEARTAELVSATQRVRDAEAFAEKHAAEARTHRQAILAGLDKIQPKDKVHKPSKADTDRILALQGQLTAANALVKRYQQEADAASDRLRSAEERIAGLEAYQEQSSREGVTIRRQLQGAMRETQALQAQNSDLKNQLAGQQLETNAMSVQHNTLKDLLAERGISPTAARHRGSPRDGSPEQPRVRELEQQLAQAQVAHDETKRDFADQANESREKLTQLENDYQSAVHYVKGTEKMLKQLKDQLAKYKSENGRLGARIDELEEKSSASGANATRDLPADWEAERRRLSKQVDSLTSEMNASKAELEKQVQLIRRELDSVQRERDVAVRSTEEAASRLHTSRRDFEQLQQENNLLERRAQDAEQKVSLLLDQVETSVGNYRRRSRQVASMNSDQLRDASSASGLAAVGGAVPGANGGAVGPPDGHSHARQESSDAGSTYGSIGEARNSAALDTLANELETLRTHWETTSKNYRLSNNFEFDNNVVAMGRREVREDEGLGLSESLADWRKRLDS